MDLTEEIRACSEFYSLEKQTMSFPIIIVQTDFEVMNVRTAFLKTHEITVCVHL